MEDVVEKDMTPKLIGDTYMKYPTEKSSRKYRYGLYECQYCNIEFEGGVDSVKRGHTKSCGCYAREVHTTHGMSQSKFYQTWYDMKYRCYNTMRQDYKNYGGRGITVCEEWLDAANFVAWAEGTCPNIEGISLDRIDNDLGYSPENCRWADKSIQSINQRQKSNNTSGYVGVSWDKRRNKWSARVKIFKKEKHIGYYLSKEEAVQARDNYIIENNLPHKLSKDYVKETK